MDFSLGSEDIYVIGCCGLAICGVFFACCRRSKNGHRAQREDGTSTVELGMQSARREKSMPSCRQTNAVVQSSSTFPQQQFHQSAIMNGSSMDPAKVVDISENAAPSETDLDTPTVILAASSVSVGASTNNNDESGVAAGGGSFKIKPAAGFQPTPARPKAVILEYVANRPDVSSVWVYGSFNAWQRHGVRLSKSSKAENLFSALLKLRPGQYEVKFRVDEEEWALSDSLPKVETTEGHFGQFEFNLLTIGEHL